MQQVDLLGQMDLINLRDAFNIAMKDLIMSNYWSAV